MGRILISLITMVIFFSACQKENLQNNNPTPTVPAILDSNYIDTLYQTRTRGGITDTVFYCKYYYDALKRVTLIKWEINNFMQPVDGGGTETYFYTNNDTLPYKSLRNMAYNNMIQLDTIAFFYSYDNSSRLIKDSLMDFYRHTTSPPGGYYMIRKHIINYLYNSNLLVGSEISVPILDPLNNITYHITDSVTISATGNPASSVEYSGSLKIFSASIAYDNNPNPHNKLNISKSFSPLPATTHHPDFYASFIGKNNFNSYNTISFSPPNTNTTSTYTNTYLPNGYLLKAVTPSPTIPGDIEAWLYKYKAL